MFKTTTLITALAGLTLSTSGIAGTLSISNTAPVADSDDIQNTASGQTLKWFNDIEKDAGQTFTAVADGQLVSFTTRIGPTQSNPADAGTESILLRFGTVSGTPGTPDWAFNETYSETVSWTEDMASNDYLTWSFDTPQTVTNGVEYAVITQGTSFGSWREGIPYLARSNGSSYAGGHMINRGNANTGSDLDFTATIVTAPIPEPGSLALLGLGSLLVARRRRG